MYPTNYTFLFATVLIFIIITDSTNISSYQDSRYLTKDGNNFYLENSIHRLRHSSRKRQTDTSCRVPENSDNNRYKVLSQFETNYRSGDSVPSYTALETLCNTGYKLKPIAQSHSLCVNGIWIPKPPTCLSACSSLRSIVSTNVKCSHDAIPLDNCFDPVEGTTVLLTCNPLYEESSILHSPIYLCTEGQWEPPLIQCRPMCGQKRPVGVTNIINGRDTVEGDYPWHVGIYKTVEDEYICGGSIISPKLIVSAAHCFTNYEGVAFPSTNYMVAAGKYHRKYRDSSDLHAQYPQLKEIKIPEKYRGRTTLQAFDIAVLILKTPVVLSIAVQPVCIELNEGSPQLQLTLSGNGTVTGWGLTQEGGDLSDVLKEVVIPYVPFDKCYNEVPMSFRKYFTPDKLCGGYLNSGTGICGGDSGGGYVFNKTAIDRYFIKGVVSTSPATEAIQCDSNQYSLYTSIDAHIEFLRNIIIHNQIRTHLDCKYDRCKRPEESTSGAITPTRTPTIDRPASCCPPYLGCSYSRYSYAGCTSTKGHMHLVKRMVDMIF